MRQISSKVPKNKKSASARELLMRETFFITDHHSQPSSSPSSNKISKGMNCSTPGGRVKCRLDFRYETTSFIFASSHTSVQSSREKNWPSMIFGFAAWHHAGFQHAAFAEKWGSQPVGWVLGGVHPWSSSRCRCVGGI